MPPKGKFLGNIREFEIVKIVWPRTIGVRIATHMELKHREKQGKISANFQNAWYLQMINPYNG